MARVFIVLALSTTLSAESDLVQVRYTGFSDEGRAAFQHAVDRWANLVAFRAPFVIEAKYDPDSDKVLGFEVSLSCLDRYASCMPSVLANNPEGRDLSPDRPEQKIYLLGLPDWYMGLDGNPPEHQVDMVTTVMHVIGHGLGILSGAESAGEGSVVLDRIYGHPYLYDRALWTEEHGLLTDLPSPSETLNEAVTQESLVWGDVEWHNVHGETMRSPLVNEGPVPLLSWATFQDITHVFHLDPHFFPEFTDEALMGSYLYSQGKSHHTVGPVTLAMLHDMGWTLTDDGEDIIESRREFYPIPSPRRMSAKLRERDGWVDRIVVDWSNTSWSDPRLNLDHWEVRGSADWPERKMSEWLRTDDVIFEFNNFTDFGTTYRWEVRAVGTHGQKSAPPHASVEILVPESSRRPAPPDSVHARFYRKGIFHKDKDVVTVKWGRGVLGPQDPRRTVSWEIRSSPDWPNKSLSGWVQHADSLLRVTEFPKRGTTYRWEVRAVGPTGLRSAAPYGSAEMFIPND